MLILLEKKLVCSKCEGNMYYGKDEDGIYFKCWNCGKTIWIKHFSSAPNPSPTPYHYFRREDEIDIPEEMCYD